MTPAKTQQGERQGVSPPSTPHVTALSVLQSLATYRMNDKHWMVSDLSAMWQNAKNRTRRADALPLAGETLFHNSQS